MRGGVELGAALEEGGVFYGGAEEPSLQVVTLDPVTGVATSGPPLTGATGHFYALAPLPIPSGVSEPSTWAMMLAGFAGLGYVGYRPHERWLWSQRKIRWSDLTRPSVVASFALIGLRSMRPFFDTLPQTRKA